MRLMVTGANGFVGSALCAEGLARGYHVTAAVRPDCIPTAIPSGVEVLEGNFATAEGAHALVSRSRPDAVIHAAAVISIGRPNASYSWRVNVEGTENLAKAAIENGCRRWLQVSSMSAHPGNKAVYGASKFAADKRLQSLPLDLTIFRPSLIYGPAQRGIFYKLVNLVRGLPVIPLVGGGEEPMRPVHVQDLATAFYTALENDQSIGKTYCLGGPEDDWTFRRMIRAICDGIGKKPLLVPVPLPICRLIAAAGEFLLVTPPLTSDNVEGVAKAEFCETSLAEDDLAWSPRSFHEGFAQCLEAGLLKKKSE